MGHCGRRANGKETQMKITFDTDEIKATCIDAQTFALNAEAEKSIVRLLDIQEQLNEFIEQVKQGIIERAQEIDANFTSITGDNIKLEYRETGSKFTLVDHETVDTTFVTLTERMAVNAKAVERFMAENNGELPAGVKMNERKKSIIIKRKDK